MFKRYTFFTRALAQLPGFPVGPKHTLNQLSAALARCVELSSMFLAINQAVGRYAIESSLDRDEELRKKAVKSAQAICAQIDNHVLFARQQIGAWYGGSQREELQRQLDEIDRLSQFAKSEVVDSLTL